MDPTFEVILTDARIRLVAGLADRFGVQVYLVGGCLRDVVMSRPVHDFDFALSGADKALPAELARCIGGHFFWLDRERRQSRVVTGSGPEAFTFDFSPIRGDGILEDLALRDFTVNALGLEVTSESADVLDPLSGRQDIARQRIRACGPNTFDDDPLRLLRAVRFAATLDFAIDDDTWRELRQRCHLLERVAGERLRDELFGILGARNAAKYLAMLLDAGLFPRIAPGLFESATTFCEPAERLAFVAEVERVLDGLQGLFPDEREPFAAHLERSVEGGIPLLSLVKLAALLSGENARKHIRDCADRIRLGTKARAELASLCDCLVAFPSLPEGTLGERVLYRFFRDREPGGPELVILPLAARTVNHGTAASLVSYYFRDYRAGDADLLLSGDQVMELLGIGPGPRLGEVLETLREAESTGRVTTEREAREFILKNQLTTAGR
ncbi:MAG TPA: hypothetical protein PLI53_01715 [Geobacteraceae bacterium]|nr:hypothetical protein [Geobacteraceae bacterium]